MLRVIETRDWEEMYGERMWRDKRGRFGKSERTLSSPSQEDGKEPERDINRDLQYDTNQESVKLQKPSMGTVEKRL